MPRKLKDPQFCPAWFVQAAEVMVRTNQSLKQAAVELGLALDPEEIERIARRRDFGEILRTEQNKHYAGVANDPTRSKSVAIGKMEVLIDCLIKAGEYDKAGALIEKLGKLEGWTGADSNVNIFSGLTARDIAEARERLQGVESKTVGVSKDSKTAEPGVGSGLPC